MENRYSIILAITLVSAMLLLGCIGQNGVEGNGVIKKNDTNAIVPGNETNNGTVAPSRCEDMASEMEGCIIQRAYDNDYIYDCYLLAGDHFKQCINKMGAVNYSYCMKLDNATEVDSCLLAVVDRFGDEACDMVANETLRTSCLLRDYTEGCRNMTDEYQRTLCNAIEKADASFCSDLDDAAQADECYMNYSVARGENACGTIRNPAMKTACEGVIAGETNCGTLAGTQVQANCYLYYAIYTDECSWCDPIGDATYKDDCYKRCAAASETMSACAKLSTEVNRDNCYWNYATSVLDVAACEKIKINSFERTCTQQVALANAKPAECESMKLTPGLSQTDVSNCYMQAITGSTVSFDNCVAMDDAYMEDTCVYNAIRREGMSTDYCAYIQDNALRTECLKQ